MAKQLEKINCGCLKAVTAKFAKSNKCSECYHLFCDSHLYTYVDESNRNITKNSKTYCEKCFKEKYKNFRS